jgi:hypothetical protein
MMYADPRKMRENAREGLEQMGEATADASRRAADAMNDNMRAFGDMSTVLTSGVQEFSQEWWNVLQSRWRTNFELLNKLLGSRTLADAISVQGELAKSNLQQPFEDARRLMELSLQLASRMTRQAENNMEHATDEARRAA